MWQLFCPQQVVCLSLVVCPQLDVFSSLVINVDNDGALLDLIKDVELRLEGQARFDRQIISFFNVNRYNHNKEGGALKGIYGYSFALDNDKFQPSGSCNFSRLGNKELSFTLKNLNLNKYPRRGGLPFTGNYRIFVIAENINFYRVLSGMSGKIFDN